MHIPSHILHLRTGWNFESDLSEFGTSDVITTFPNTSWISLRMYASVAAFSSRAFTFFLYGLYCKESSGAADKIFAVFYDVVCASHAAIPCQHKLTCHYIGTRGYFSHVSGSGIVQSRRTTGTKKNFDGLSRSPSKHQVAITETSSSVLTMKIIAIVDCDYLSSSSDKPWIMKYYCM